MSKINEVIELFGKLESFEVNAVLLQLLRSKKLDFTKLSEIYVKYLEQEDMKNRTQVTSLSYHLAAAVDDILDKKHARKLLFQSGFFEGSIYGDKLNEEFKNS